MRACFVLVFLLLNYSIEYQYMKKYFGVLNGFIICVKMLYATF